MLVPQRCTAVRSMNNSMAWHWLQLSLTFADMTRRMTTGYMMNEGQMTFQDVRIIIIQFQVYGFDAEVLGAIDQDGRVGPQLPNFLCTAADGGGSFMA